MSSVEFSSLSVLIVDDNRHMRTVVRTILEMLGVRRIREAADGADALKTFAQFQADLIVCDRVMAPMDGVEFITRVRTSPDSPNPDVPILMLTAHTDVQRIVEARDAGVHDILAKPISAKSLAERITTLLARPRPFARPASGRYPIPAFTES
jgi:two-component system, chemotaxis family, chemotaxis protein CheY